MRGPSEISILRRIVNVMTNEKINENRISRQRHLVINMTKFLGRQ